MFKLCGQMAEMRGGGGGGGAKQGMCFAYPECEGHFLQMLKVM